MDAKSQILKGGFVAIVDDDTAVRNSTRRLLHSLGVPAVAFASAEDFLESGSMANIVCVLLDLCMPGMSGLEMQQRLVKTGRQILIVFLSAQASETEKLGALLAGAADFLDKPVNKAVLLHAIHGALKSPND